MILPYLPFALLSIYNLDIKHVLLQMSLLINIVDPNSINPGVFWFFGLIIQFYVLFALLRTIKSRKYLSVVLILLNVISIACLVVLKNDTPILNWARHNCIGWLLPFSMGLWCAHSSKWSVLFDTWWKNLLWVVIGGLLVVLSNLNYYLWMFGPVVAIFAAIGLARIIKNIRVVDSACIGLGSLSAFIFAIHPLVRFLCQKICMSEMDRLPYLLGYISVTLVLSIVYRYIHKRFLSAWL